MAVAHLFVMCRCVCVRVCRQNTIRDLLRVIRNKKHHYRDLPEDVQQVVGALPDGYLSYFAKRYPMLLLEAYWFVVKCCAHEYTFKPYLHGDSELPPSHARP